MKSDVNITVARQWGFADTGSERLSGEREPFPADFDEDEPGWEMFALSFRRSEGTFRGLPPVSMPLSRHPRAGNRWATLPVRATRPHPRETAPTPLKIAGRALSNRVSLWSGNKPIGL